MTHEASRSRPVNADGAQQRLARYRWSPDAQRANSETGQIDAGNITQIQDLVAEPVLVENPVRNDLGLTAHTSCL